MGGFGGTSNTCLATLHTDSLSFSKWRKRNGIVFLTPSGREEDPATISSLFFVGWSIAWGNSHTHTHTGCTAAGSSAFSFPFLKSSAKWGRVVF